MNSKPYWLNSSDFAKGFIVAVIAALFFMQQALMAHGLDFGAYDWMGIWQFVGGAALAYLTKNFFSDDQGRVITPLGRVG